MTSEKCPGTEVATSFDHLIGTSQAHASEIRNLQQLTVADPGSGKVGLGLAGCGAITAGLVQFRQPVIRPAIGGRPAERALELPLRLGFTQAPLLFKKISNVLGGLGLRLGSAGRFSTHSAGLRIAPHAASDERNCRSTGPDRAERG